MICVNRDELQSACFTIFCIHNKDHMKHNLIITNITKPCKFTLNYLISCHLCLQELLYLLINQVFVVKNTRY